jgi:type II secretory pathway predicted ATPase ExeA
MLDNSICVATEFEIVIWHPISKFIKPFLMKHLPIISLAMFIMLSFRADCRTEMIVPADIDKEFVRFDQAFLPVLFYVTEGNSFEAKRAVFHLSYHWQLLKNRYETIVALPDWINTFRRVEKLLNAAFYAIDANQQAQAQLQLEQVKQELIDLRLTYRIDYYLDYLYDFQATAAIFRETVEDERLTLLEWEDVMAMVVDLNRKWNVVLAKQLDADLYEFDKDQIWKLRTTQQSVSQAMKEVNTAMEGADRAMVAKASKNLNVAFLEVLRLFGNFKAATTYYANAQ